MILKTFIENFVEPNTLIRLWLRCGEGGYEQLEDPSMEWELERGEYADKIVIGVKDILMIGDNYIEAVNIIIEI